MVVSGLAAKTGKPRVILASTGCIVGKSPGAPSSGAVPPERGPMGATPPWAGDAAAALGENWLIREVPPTAPLSSRRATPQVKERSRVRTNLWAVMEQAPPTGPGVHSRLRGTLCFGDSTPH